MAACVPSAVPAPLALVKPAAERKLLESEPAPKTMLCGPVFLLVSVIWPLAAL